ncbi:MAG: phenylalanine--tRNA ligase subunit alpha [Candidatus Kerfeldbacteria bacterium]|nr:phenylalanine--tRNA ligase subunit alpha [Candidatus Kerfeldbacteria bacterium]
MITADQIQALINHGRTALASTETVEQFEQLRDHYFGRKQGELVKILRSIQHLDNVEHKRQLGALANNAKQELQQLFSAWQNQHHHASTTLVPDVTLPGIWPTVGHVHPLRQLQEELVDIFYAMGFMVMEGNELENELYCFEYLNIPPHHPARDLQDTFYVSGDDQGVKRVLRTHTSNMQVRLMQQYTPPLRAVVPGRAFRNEAIDASHEHTFYQMEGFVVDENISLGNLTYFLKTAMSRVLQSDVQVRLRPGYFPYVEPGFEADCSCTHCAGQGCAVCKYTGWVEMLGCGLIHPTVFASAGYEPGKYTGFAFGMGLMRLAMLKYNIDDIRLFMGGDFRFIDQF